VGAFFLFSHGFVLFFAPPPRGHDGVVSVGAENGSLL
jgi:hypothetical protein